MIQYSNCKINLGLNVIRKRPDGYHDINSLMFPVRGLADTIEIITTRGANAEFSSSGIPFDCPNSKNLCVRAYELFKQQYGIGGVKMHIRKEVPFGAGLGGGSSNAVTVIKMLDEIFGTNLGISELESLAAQLGSDTVFFVRNTPAIISGRGEIVTPVEFSLAGRYLVIVKPDVHVSTADAYAAITPRTPEKPIGEIIRGDISAWKTELKNDFEDAVFKIHPELQRIKNSLYESGAAYAAMSGSGSAVFGIFCAPPMLTDKFEGAFVREMAI